MTPAFAALVLLAGVSAAAPPHTDEIDAYAFVLAVAQIASDRCVDILISQPMLEDMRTQFHISKADGPSMQREGSAVAQVLVDRIAATPSLQAWCYAAYRA